ncbi:MAG: hypothetical protein GXO76_02990 [Calditrichaeota bacterium]|nr:hypothetical protein [Calditrichota bacterium]
MKKKAFGEKVLRLVITPVLLALFSVGAQAQSVGLSFYTVSPDQGKSGKLYLNYDTNYGVRAIRPFGEDGVEQRAGVVYGITSNLSLLGVAGALIDRNSAVHAGSVQLELMQKILSQKDHFVNLAASVGFLREYLGTNVLMARLALGRDFGRFNLRGNAVFEKPFAKNRDPMDVITTAAVGYRIFPWLWGGIDAVGEDLEGFFEPDEAEGGAKLMVGPTVQMHFSSKMQMRLGAGPIFYLTKSTPISEAPRYLPPGKSGYTIRVSMIYGI